MKQLKLFVIVAMASIAASCAKENPQEPTPVVPEGYQLVNFTASITKTAISSDDKTVTWVAGDEVTFAWDGGSQVAQATTSGTSTQFNDIIVPQTVTEIYAVYPSSAFKEYTLGTGVVLTFPKSTTLSGDSFAGSDICIARTELTKAAAINITFKNAACLFKLGSTADITKYVVTAPGKEKISGDLPVSIDATGVLSYGTVTEGADTVILRGITEAGNYYIPVLPSVTLSEGFKVDMYAGEQTFAPFCYTQSITTSAGSIIGMPEIDTRAGKYYVTPEGAGNKSGINWTNAMSASDFKTFIEIDNSVNYRGTTFYFSAGEFDFGGYVMPKFSTSTLVNITLQGSTQGTTVFKGGSDYGALDPQDKVDLTVKNVKFTGVNSTSGGRAAVRANKSGIMLTLKDCEFTENTNSSTSAAIMALKGDVTIDGCTFTSNSATDGSAIYINNAGGGTLNLVLKNSSISSGTGSYVYVNACNSLSIDSTTFNGSAKRAIYFVGGGTIGDVEIDHSAFTDNTVSSANGGAILFGTGSKYSIKNTTFSGNHCRAGGAICVTTDGVSFSNCTFDGNYADGTGEYNSAGGVVYVPSNVTVDFSGCTFKNNYSTHGSTANTGGIIRVMNAGAVMRFDNCLFDSNYDTASSNLSDTSGAAIVLSSSVAPKFYFNACEFNKNQNKKGMHGMVFGTTNATGFFFNNCSFHDNWSGRNSSANMAWICVNQTSDLVISNSTIYGAQYNNVWAYDNRGVIRFNGSGDPTSDFYLINNILLHPTASTGCCIQVGSKNDLYVQTGKAKYNKTCPGDTWTHWNSEDDTGSAHDYSTSSFGGWTAPYTWNGTMTGTNSTVFAPTSDITTFLTQADTDLGSSFCTWLDSIGALGKDIKGNERGTYSWPGCYQSSPKN